MCGILYGEKRTNVCRKGGKCVGQAGGENRQLYAGVWIFSVLLLFVKETGKKER